MRGSTEVWSIEDEVSNYSKLVKENQYFIDLPYADFDESELRLFLEKSKEGISSAALMYNTKQKSKHQNSIHLPIYGYIPLKKLKHQIERIEQCNTKLIQVNPGELSPPGYDYVITCNSLLNKTQLIHLHASRDAEMKSFCKEKIVSQITLMTDLQNMTTQEEFINQLSLAYGQISSKLNKYKVDYAEHISPAFRGLYLPSSNRSLFYHNSSLSLDPVFFAFTTPEVVMAMSPIEKELSSNNYKLSFELNDLAAQLLPLHIIDQQISRTIPAIESDAEFFAGTELESKLDIASDFYMELLIHSHSLTNRSKEVKKESIDIYEFFGIETHWIDFEKSAKEIVNTMQSDEIPTRFHITLG